MRKLFNKTLLVALLFVGGCVSTPERSPELQQQILLVEDAIKIGDYDRANEIIKGLSDHTSNPKEIQTELALKLLNSMADQGHSQTLIEVGKLYFSGVDVQQDYETALTFFKRQLMQGMLRRSIYWVLCIILA